MAELSEHDKIALLGANYKELEKQAQTRSGITDATREAREREAWLESISYGAFGVGAVALLLVLGNLYGGSATGSSPTLLWTSLAVAVIGAGAGWYTNGLKKALAATGKSRA